MKLLFAKMAIYPYSRITLLCFVGLTFKDTMLSIHVHHGCVTFARYSSTNHALSVMHMKLLSTALGLQELKINHLVHGDLSTSLSIIHLPQLKSLHYTGNPESYSRLFSKVNIPPSCSLNIWLRYPPRENEIITAPERTRRLLSAVDVFTRYAEHSLQAHTLNSVTMNLGYTPKSYISFSIGNVLMGGCSLNIHISLDGADTSSPISPTVFFDKLSELDLSL